MIKTFEELQDFFISRRQLGIQLGLERLYYLLNKLGNPEKDLPAVHIAGTNGKGSTLTFLRQVLMDSGYRVGSFVSPGLPTILDHIYLDEKRIDLDEFVQLLNDMMPIINEMDQEGISPTEYEILMVITLLYFKDNVDMALIETAMGGREDITNCVEPLLTMITNVSNDHIDFLGPTLADIAEHKAGIIKKNIPVILGDIKEEVLPNLKQAANDKNASMYQFGKDYKVKHIHTELDKQVFLWKSADLEIEVEISMLGSHQIQNASCAMMACELLIEQGLTIDEQTLSESFQKVSIPYRMEKISENPDIYIDGAHNEAGIHAFSRAVSQYFSPEDVVIVFGVFKDKDVHKMIDILKARFENLYAMEFQHPRAMKKADYDELKEEIHVLEDTTAMRQLLMEKRNKKICFVGSLHFVSYMKDYLNNG